MKRTSPTQSAVSQPGISLASNRVLLEYDAIGVKAQRQTEDEPSVYPTETNVTHSKIPWEICTTHRS